MRSCKVLILAALLAALFHGAAPEPSWAASPSAGSGGEGPVTRLPEMVVTGTVLPGDIRDIPANVQVIGPEEIKKSGAVTLVQLLERTTATLIPQQPGNWGPFALRGMRSNQSTSSTLGDKVLLLIDGNRAGTGNLGNIPLANVERVEILRGSGSVQYGGSAVGGVINLISKRGQGPATGKISAQYGSFDAHALNASVSAGLADNRVGLSVAAQADGSGNYKTGDGGEAWHDTRRHAAGGAASLVFRPEDGTDVGGVFIANKVYDTGNPGDIFYPNYKRQVKNDYLYGALNFDKILAGGFSVRASLFGNQNEYEDINGDSDYNSLYDVRTFGGRLTGGIPLPDLASFSLGELALGLEYALHQQKLGGSSVGEPDVDTDVWSFFAEHKFAAGPVNFQYGLRYDYYDYDIKKGGATFSEGGAKTFSRLTWGAGAVWRLADWLGLRAAARAAYVPPTAIQLVGDYNVPAWYTSYKGNPDLDPEKSMTLEFGLDIQYGGLSADIGYFDIDYKNKIEVVYGAVATWKNLDKQRLSGLEGNVRYTRAFQAGERALTIEPYAGFEYFIQRRNSDDAATRVIMHLPKYTATAGLGAGFGIVWLDLNAQMTGRNKCDDFSDYSKHYYGAFTLFNARVSVNPWEGLSIFGEVRNIGDKYYAYKPEFPMPGRTWMAGVSYEF